MKRLLFILLILAGTASQSFASFYVDLMGAMVNADDLENQSGLGLGLGYVLNDNLDLCLRSTYTMATDNADLSDEINYDHMTVMTGVSYVPKLPLLERFRLNWKNTFLAGYSMSEFDEDLTGSHFSDQGLALAFLTGLQFDATQMISPFFDIGYHKSFYENDMEDASVQGFQFALGVRFYIGNTQKYSNGY